MKILLFYPISRKTYDLYCLLRNKFEGIQIRFEAKNTVERLFTTLLYGKNWKQINNNESYIILPQEVEQVLKTIEEDSKNKYCFDSKEKIVALNNKENFSKIATRLKIKHPKTWSKPFSLETNKKLIFKPKEGKGSKGIYIKNCKGAETIPKNYIVQEYLGNSNEIYGFFAFAVEGVVISSYCHKRIETFPRNGGVSVLCERITNKELSREGHYVVEKLMYSGLIMIEFKCFNNTFYVIEVNPRLWGSSALMNLINLDPLSHYIIHLLPELSKKYKEPRKKHNNINFLIWLLPYGLFRTKVWKYFKKSIIINWPSSGGPLKYLFVNIIILTFKALIGITKKLKFNSQ